MNDQRKTVEFDDSVDAESAENYRSRIRRAQQQSDEGGVPLGGAKPLQGLPVLTQAQEDARNKRDQLPEQDRAYREDELRDLVRSGQAAGGIGSAYPANQQISTGRAPKATPPGQLSEETKEGLAALEEANKPEEKKAPGEETGEDIIAKMPPNMDPEFLKVLMGPQFDHMARKERREAIEKRCDEIDLRHYLVGRGGEQRVPIIPDVLEPTYRAPNGKEDSFAKRFTWEIVRESAGEEGSQQYYDTILGMVLLGLSLRKLNDEEIVDHREEDGSVNEDVFSQKFDDLMTRPYVVLRDLHLNFIWFDERIRDKLDQESLGNG